MRRKRRGKRKRRRKKKRRGVRVCEPRDKRSALEKHQVRALERGGRPQDSASVV
jgi:hypothetical protein